LPLIFGTDEVVFSNRELPVVNLVSSIKIEECLERNPPFSDYVSTMTPLPSINAVGNAGFTDPEFIPSVPVFAFLM
jgi:hypothetical protein